MQLLYEFYETASPHVREPLTERVAQLAAAQFPGLATLRSCDLHSSSWIAVAWCAFLCVTDQRVRSMLWRCLRVTRCTCVPHPNVSLSRSAVGRLERYDSKTE